MNVFLMTLQLWHKFERRWTARLAQDESQRFPSQGAEGCNACGRLAKAPVHGTYLPSGDVVYQWRCSECRNAWQTSVYPANSNASQSDQSEHFPDNAAPCLTLEQGASHDAAGKQFARRGASWLALAETEDWLDGALSPVAPHERLIRSAPNAPRGDLA